MASQTLKELKAENAATAAATNDAPVGDKKEIIEDEYVEVVEQVKADDTGSKPEDEGSQEVELEDWQLTEETETSEDEQKGGFVPNHEAAKRRKKNQALRGEIKEKDSELEELRKQVNALQSGTAPKVEQEQAALVRPTLDYDGETRPRELAAPLIQLEGTEFVDVKCILHASNLSGVKSGGSAGRASWRGR